MRPPLADVLHGALVGPLVASAAKEGDFRAELKAKLQLRPFWLLAQGRRAAQATLGLRETLEVDRLESGRRAVILSMTRCHDPLPLKRTS
jgi:hypothetical protein